MICRPYSLISDIPWVYFVQIRDVGWFFARLNPWTNIFGNRQVAQAAVRSKSVVQVLLIHCLLLLPVFVGVLCLVLVL